MSARRMTGLFQPFKNVPISPPASINASPRVSEDDLEAESGDVTRARPGYNTMMHLLSDRRAELQLFGSETQMSKLQDLSNLMFTRGRLQELGCTFSEVGKLLTYGDPSSLKEWDRLLRLGPIYDEQWALFFPAPLGQQDNDTADMWSDLRTLKRVLANDGVAFGGRHRRLTRGDRSGKLLRLCAAYDDLYKLWSASVTERGSKRAMTSVDERQENGSNGSFGDSRSSMNKRHGQAQAFPGASVGKHPKQGNTISGTSKISKDEPKPTQHPTRPQSEVPRNLGWRFSDDFDPATAARNRDSMDHDTYYDIEEKFQLANSVPLVIVEAANSPRTPPPVQSHQLRPAIGLRHGPSPLQNVTTQSMILCDELLANPRGDNLEVDANIMAAIGTIPYTEVVETKPTQKKSIKGWLRGVFHKSPKKERRAAVQPKAAWWTGR
jgi:hypothetical protein